MFKHLNTLNPFDWFLITGITSLNLAYLIISDEMDSLGAISAISGVVCVVLVAKGNILNYLFGLINVSTYAYISYKADLYGDAALNFFYYLPMQIVGWFMWIRKRQNSESVTVKAGTMTFLQRVMLVFISIISVVLGAYILKYYEDPQPLKDSATTILSIIAMYLMVRRYMEQWPLWVVVNLISVIMWISAYYQGEEHSFLMIIMWIFYLINSLNGWRVWILLTRQSSTQQ